LTRNDPEKQLFSHPLSQAQDNSRFAVKRGGDVVNGSTNCTV